MSPSPVERFSDRAGYYTRYRPDYPRAVVELLAGEAGLTAHAVIVDIGSGTGLSSRLFLDAGYTVYGVEPNAAMRAAAEEALGGRAGFHSIDGRAEATTLPDAMADLAVAATAFHWFEAPSAADEFRRILKPGAFVALFWNTRATSASGFMSDYEQLLISRLPEYADRWARERGRQADPARAFLGETLREAHFDNRQDLHFDAMLGRLASSSYAPLPGSEAYEPLVAELRAVFDRRQRNGVVSFVYDTRVYYGPLR